MGSSFVNKSMSAWCKNKRIFIPSVLTGVTLNLSCLGPRCTSLGISSDRASAALSISASLRIWSKVLRLDRHFGDSIALIRCNLVTEDRQNFRIPKSRLNLVVSRNFTIQSAGREILSSADDCGERHHISSTCQVHCVTPSALKLKGMRGAASIDSESATFTPTTALTSSRIGARLTKYQKKENGGCTQLDCTRFKMGMKIGPRFHICER